MAGLTLGDLVFDARRAAYARSLKALVLADLNSALNVGIAGGLRGVVERLEALITEYSPENLIILGELGKSTPVAGIVRRWGSKCKIHFVCGTPEADARELAESLDCEVHNELVWGSYRFVEESPIPTEAGELGILTVSAKPNFSVSVGYQPFTGV